MIKPLVSAIRIKKISGDNITDAEDLLAAEEPLEIRIGFGPAAERSQRSISVTMRTPGHDFELALGFLFTENIIALPHDVSSIRYCLGSDAAGNQGNIVRVELKEHVNVDFDKLQRNFYTTSSCGVCGKASIDAVRTVKEVKQDSSFMVEKNRIYGLPDKLRAHQNVFEHTGGLHASALFTLEGNLEILREDVGRHNALDKVVGAALGLIPQAKGESFSLSRHILLLSGRASFELVQKAAMANIKVVCAVGAPSSLAVELAKEFDMTLIGFLRESRFNIYANEQRIK